MSRFPALIVAALLAGGASAGCGGAQETPPVTPEPVPSTASVVPSVETSVVDDPPGSLACAALAQAITDSSLMNPGVVDGVVQAASTADAPVADAADRLLGAYGKAVSSAGTEGEPDAVAAVSAAASDMSSVCSDSGLQTVG
ncbi:hypothetical protein JIG36_24615 [Actinoplanes sp. LDG1-06]|uniref:Antifreeze protein n=1 Tax=Paractinoplanes ovalisporus TaxID=2810368 RepID=A0ABS2AG00_9ACTN|nr:hypothetical protein [Actinoplanes ovalisporus]MBM2618745.1 hypothetical protein [Actinoplanes ovalisporus]